MVILFTFIYETLLFCVSLLLSPRYHDYYDSNGIQDSFFFFCCRIPCRCRNYHCCAVQVARTNATIHCHQIHRLLLTHGRALTKHHQHFPNRAAADAPFPDWPPSMMYSTSATCLLHRLNRCPAAPSLNSATSNSLICNIHRKIMFNRHLDQ